MASTVDTASLKLEPDSSTFLKDISSQNTHLHIYICGESLTNEDIREGDYAIVSLRFDQQELRLGQLVAILTPQRNGKNKETGRVLTFKSNKLKQLDPERPLPTDEEMLVARLKREVADRVIFRKLQSQTLKEIKAIIDRDTLTT